MNDRAEAGPPDDALLAAALASTESLAPPGSSRRWYHWLVGALAWCATLTMLALAGLRLFKYDATNALTCINAFTFYVYLPAYLLAGWALWRRRWSLAVCNVFVVLLHLVLTGPDFLPATNRPSDGAAAAEGRPTVRMFYANVRADNTEYDALLQEIDEADPDIIVLIEYTQIWDAVFKRSSVLDEYRRAQSPVRYKFGSNAIYSRLPIAKWNTSVSEYRLNCELDVLVDGRILRLLVLHGPRPVDMPLHDYQGYWHEVVPLVEEQPSPLIVVGDFNMTQYAEVYQRLTATRLRSAHADVGRGYATTWPNGRFWLPPIRIDHVLVSPEVECLQIVEGRGTGSDHRPLVVDFRLRAAD